MDVRPAKTTDWLLLKQTRLNALRDAPHAFAVSYQTAANYSDERWQTLASCTAQTRFWLAIEQGKALGLVGASVSSAKRYCLIAMWVEPVLRGSTVAAQLVDAVKHHALQQGHRHVYLEVSPDNYRAAHFYVKQGFSFIDEWEPLDSHPEILLQSMRWSAPE